MITKCRKHVTVQMRDLQAKVTKRLAELPDDERAEIESYLAGNGDECANCGSEFCAWAPSAQLWLCEFCAAVTL